MKKKLLVIALVVFTIALGFLRDYIFVSINYLLDTGNDPEGKLPLLKWVLTALFSFLYLLITGTFLYILFKDRKYIWIGVFSYTVLFVVAIFSAVFGHFFTSFEHVYPFVRAVLGVAQSPVVIMILIPVCLLNSKLQSK